MAVLEINKYFTEILNAWEINNVFVLVVEPEYKYINTIFSYTIYQWVMEKKCLSMAMGYRDPPESQPQCSLSQILQVELYSWDIVQKYSDSWR